MDEPHRGGETLARGIELLGRDPFSRLEQGTREQQLAIFLCSVAAWEQRRRDLPRPVAAAGHSLGEYAALVAAGALQFEDALTLVDERAAAMADAARQRPGAMVAMLGGREDRVRALAHQLKLVVANDNAPGQLVLSGPPATVADAVERAGDETGARARQLEVSGAFHSPAMEPAAARLSAALTHTPISKPAFPVFSCFSAAPYVDVRDELADNLLRPVHWRQTLVALRRAGAEDFVELGPGRVLTGLVRRTLVAA